MRKYQYTYQVLFDLALCSLLSSNLLAQTRPSFDEVSAFVHLKKQVSFGPRNPGSHGHHQCKKYLINELGKHSNLVQEESFIHYDSFREISITMYNIIARFSENIEPRILLCAHWDTRPVADQDKNPANRTKPIPGANDGASGVAILLEIARNLAANPPPIGIDIVLFDGEDYGREGYLEEYFLGSKHFVENNTTFFPSFCILLDLVGDANLQLPIEGYSYDYAPEVVQKVWETADILGYSQFQNSLGTYINDDHVILNQAGIPAIDIIDMDYTEGEENFWHTMKDTPDKCSPESLKAVGEVLLEIIYQGIE
jgi:hypothetical protein